MIVPLGKGRSNILTLVSPLPSWLSMWFSKHPVRHADAEGNRIRRRRYREAALAGLRCLADGPHRKGFVALLTEPEAKKPVAWPPPSGEGEHLPAKRTKPELTGEVSFGETERPRDNEKQGRRFFSCGHFTCTCGKAYEERLSTYLDLYVESVG